MLKVKELEPKLVSLTALKKLTRKRALSNREIIEKKIKRKKSVYLTIKYFTEYIIALISFLMLTPFLFLTAISIKIESKGPIFFKQKRYGLKGKPFTIYKFRTMELGAHKLQEKYSQLNEMNGGKLFKLEQDPRITRLGKVLRKYSIDELPQLINILKSEMTIIGPRPLSAPIDVYKANQLQRFSVKPGLGASWQAYNRKKTSFNDWMVMDRNYVENISLKLDVKLFFVILLNVLKGKGAR